MRYNSFNWVNEKDEHKNNEMSRYEDNKDLFVPPKVKPRVRFAQ